MFLLFVLSLFHRCADGSWSAWLLLCFPIRQANGLITSPAALEGGKPNMKGGMLLVLHMPGQNHFVYRDPHDAGLGLQYLVCWPKAFGLPAIFCICVRNRHTQRQAASRWMGPFIADLASPALGKQNGRSDVSSENRWVM